MKTFKVSARQVIGYNFTIRANSKEEAQAILDETCIDHDTLEHNPEVTMWFEPYGIDLTEVK